MEKVEHQYYSDLKVDNNYKCNLQNIRNEEFMILQGHTYVDHAAAGLYSKKQLSLVFDALNSSVYGNPHSRHTPSDSVTQAIDATRNRILEHFNTTNEDYDLIFTAGATDAIKIVANYFCWQETIAETHHSLTQLQNSSINGCFVYTQENHTSILGLRESASKNAVSIYSLTTKEVLDLLEESLPDYFNSRLNTQMNTLTNISLFAYPAQCNFSGSKYPLEWIEKIHKGQLCQANVRTPLYAKNIPREKCNSKWFVLLDAASFVATSPLDLGIYKPDFVPISFYKMFGYPTGLGCLLVNKRAKSYLLKSYFGGGTVQMVDSRTMIVKRRDALYERFEDGTLPFLSILALEHGFNTLNRIAGSMKNIEDHVFNVAYYLYCNLQSMRHSNRKRVAQIYSDSKVWNKDTQGPIVNFNLIDSSGNFIGYTHIEKVSALYNIYLRTGCVCNPGACQKFLQISSLKLQKQFQAGHICGDTVDIVDGHPTGSVRVSFGYMSTYDDADRVLQMIRECFVDGQMIFDESWYQSCENRMHNKSLDMNSFIKQIHPKLSSFDQSFSTESVCISDEDTVNGEKYDIKNNEHNNSQYKVTGIIIYPVKSCSGIMVPQWEIGSCGLEFDRQWMIVTAAGVTLTQKNMPLLSLIQPHIDLKKNVLQLAFKGKGAISVNISEFEMEIGHEVIYCGGRVCGDRVKGFDCGDEVGLWLSNVLGTKHLRLMRQIQGRKNRLSSNTLDSAEKKMDNLSLANESQYLIIHEASVKHLLSQILDRGVETAITEDELKLRFRPNFIISGGNYYEEDQWEYVYIGSHQFKVHGGCTRCFMISVVPETGGTTREPLLTLAATRGSNMKFGVHASYLNESFPTSLKGQNFIGTDMTVFIKKK